MGDFMKNFVLMRTVVLLFFVFSSLLYSMDDQNKKVSPAAPFKRLGVRKKRFDFFVRGDRNQTFLYEACCHNDVRMVQLAINHGADVNARDYDGNSVLHTAVAYIA